MAPMATSTEGAAAIAGFEEVRLLDPTSLVLQVISDLCAKGIPPEKADYFQEKVHPLMSRMVEYVMNDLPARPDLAILLWIIATLGLPLELQTQVREWCEGRYVPAAPDSPRSLASPTTRTKKSSVPTLKSAMKKTPEQGGLDEEEVDWENIDDYLPERTTKRCTTYITPAGTHLSEEERARGMVYLSDAQKLQVIQSVSLFENLTIEDLRELAKAFVVESFLEGEEVIKAGSIGEGMHIVVKGEGKISVSHEVGAVRHGEIFGHTDLIQNGTASETIEAANGPLVTMHLPAILFKALGLKKKIGAMQKRKAAKRRDDTHSGLGKVQANHQHNFSQEDRKELTQEVNHKEHPVLDEDKQLVTDALHRNRNLNEVLNLSDKQVDLFVQVVYRVDFAMGEVVFYRGDYGDKFYIIREGVFEVSGTVTLVAAQKTGTLKLRAGDSFGELALLYDSPRAACVTCTQAGSVWVITRTTFRNVMRLRKEGRIQEYSELVENVSTFKDRIRLEERAALCDSFEEMYFIRGERIVQQGEEAGFFFMIFEGTCGVYKDDIWQAELVRGDSFGELALLRNDVRQATVIVTSETCTVLALDQVAFDLLLTHPLDHPPESRADEHGLDADTVEVSRSPNLSSKLKNRLQKWKQDSKDHVTMSHFASMSLSDLHSLGVLGTGSYGHVTLMRDIRPGSHGKLYALKALSKSHIVQERLKDMVLNEKSCMELIDTDFVVKLHETFRDREHIYFLLEPCFGGELFDFYNENSETFGSEEHAKFYAACVACAFDHMHERRIIYRDLKLENCLLTSIGYLKLTDLGLAKVVIGKTYTVCGTTDYFAPETLRQTGHNRAVDWWALGVMIYIMMSGRSPFDAPDPMKIYKKIIKGFAKVNFPPEFSDACVGMITGLGQKKAEERLTMGHLGVQNFKDHPWYHNFTWRLLESRKLPTPFNPAINEDDVVYRLSNAEPKPMPEHAPYEDDGTDWDKPFESLHSH